MKIFRQVIGVFLLLFVIVIIFFLFSYPFLTIYKPIKSNNLVVEAWLSGLELESIIDTGRNYNLTKIIVVGKYFAEEVKQETSIDQYKPGEFFKWNKKTGVLLLTNSSLLVDLSNLKSTDTDSVFTISIKASDTQKNKNFAHFNVILNGIWLGDSFVNNSIQEYKFKCNTTFNSNSILAICFDNDAHTSEERRNLYVQSIKLNEHELYFEHSNAVITREENLITTGFQSQAAKTIQYLKALNIDPGIIDIIEFNTAEKNQTLASALNVKYYLKDHPILDLNVTSAGVHGRRSLFTYKKVLKPKIEIGIINSENIKYNQSNWYKSPEGIRLMLDELFSYMYAWMTLSF